MIYVRETNLATYPDGSVVRGPVDAQRVVRNGKVIGEAVTNPRLVIEVLSRDSTEGYDRGEKFAHCMRLGSLEEYVLVAQDERRIEVYRRPRGRGHWLCEVAKQGGTFTMHDHAFHVDAIYSD
jgi:Uma2 family endonuclease